MSILICPVCGEQLNKIGKCAVCINAHSYDYAKSGYLNLLVAGLKRTVVPGDNADMISARRSLMQSGYYKSLVQEIAKYLPATEGAEVLDVGCGEGYITYELSKIAPKLRFTGADISKFAVCAASKQDKTSLYIAAGAAALPVASHSIDTVINVFAPIYSAELVRVLKHGGSLIKVTPAARHLWEIKTFLYDKPYENAEEGLDFGEACKNVESVYVSDSITLTGSQTEALLQMTPYYYKTAPEALARLAAQPSFTTGLEFKITVYKFI